VNRGKRIRSSMSSRVALLAFCAVGSLLVAPTVVAGVSGTVSDNATGIGCLQSAFGGGAGFAAASIGPITCATELQAGGSFSSLVSASGSWITGDFAASATAAANPAAGTVPASPSVTGMAAFSVVGTVSLPNGMTSASITFGATGLSGTADDNIGDPGHFSSGDIVTLEMAGIGSGGSVGSSIACLLNNAFDSACPGGGLGLGFGPGALAPITLTVFDGESLELNVTVVATAFASALTAPTGTSASVTIDPLYLTLPDGVTFDSGIAGFLSGPATTTVAEPGSLLLVLVALGMVALRVGRWDTRVK